MIPAELKWRKYEPGRNSWIRQNEEGVLYEIKSGNKIPLSGNFSFELEDGTIIEREGDDSSCFIVKVPTSRDFEITYYRFSSDSGSPNFWETANEYEETSTTSQEKKQKLFPKIKLDLNIALYEKIMMILFFTLVFGRVFLIDRAMQGESKILLDTSSHVDTSDEYIPDSKEPLEVKRH